MLTPHEIADKIWELPDTDIVEIDEMIVNIIRDNNAEGLSELQIGENSEKYLPLVIRILEEKMYESIQKDINPRFSFSEKSRFRIIGSANIGNQALLTQLTTDVVFLIDDVNAIQVAKSAGEIFSLTQTSFKSQPILQKPVKTKNDFSEYIDALYFLVYEGSVKTSRIPKVGLSDLLDQANSAKFKDDFIIIEINNLRLHFRHDIHLLSDIDKQKLIHKVSEICKKYTGKDSIAQFQQPDYLKIQEGILKELKKFLSKLKTVL